MNIMQKISKGSVSLALCVAMITTYQGHAMQMADPCFQMPCDSQRSCAQENCFGAGLAAILCGVAAGAGVGYAASHRSSHGHSHHCEKKSQPQKPCAKSCGCTNDCLTFKVKPSVSLRFIGGGGTYNATVQIFATTPDGCTVLGSSSTRSGTITNNTPNPLLINTFPIETVVTEACCGAYQIGYLLEVIVSDYTNLDLFSNNTFASIDLASVTNCAGDTQYLFALGYELETDLGYVPSPAGLSFIELSTTLSAQFSIFYSYNPPSCGAPSCSASSSSCD